MTPFTLCAATSSGNAHNNHYPNHHQITDQAGVEQVARLDHVAATHTLLVQISDLENRKAAYCYYKEQLATFDPVSIEFTPYLWHTLIDHAEVDTDGAIMFMFRDGISRQQLIGK
ncbi:hypothetical protein HMPREF2822_03835 [Corynebacterium sp. HMSC062E11]|uniref:hypothetical protein n=1 Tax=Corynebacterium sp. HMSC062E11 TaxID=1739326 RepID=UPI0008A491A6|nr:hypothetical protein [Corynebacterium sp. HMSC062E11]OFK29404.1 hypothetical protein HMPREF2822_03835 [Corynebacterium sp. HMSC062E11]